MLLTCDIGNSEISFGLFEKKALKHQFNVNTDKNKKESDFLKEIKPNISAGLKINKVIIASVVPSLTSEIASALAMLTEVSPKILKNSDVPVINKYGNPEKVGTDRLLNAFGALNLYKPPLIIIDFGTATTFDVVSAQGEYLGGAIVPGVETSLAALFGKASKLDAVKLKKPVEIIGHTTEESIRSGVVIGTAGLIDKMICEIEKSLGESTKLATGGLSDLIIPYSEKVKKIELNLTLKAMAKLSD